MSKKTEVITVSIEEVTPDAHESDAKQAIMDLVSSWGKRATYRYLRDHGLLEAFTEALPLGSYEETDEVTITDILKASWDDFSTEKLEELREWHQTAAEGALGIRVAAYAAHLHGLGFTTEAAAVLRISSTVDAAQKVDTCVIEAAQLEVGDIVQKLGSAQNPLGYHVGFGAHQLPGRITEVQMNDGVVTAKVYLPQTDDVATFSATADTAVTVLHVVRPHYARSLQTSALAKLQATEAALDSNPELQSRVARLRHMLETRIQEDE